MNNVKIAIYGKRIAENHLPFIEVLFNSLIEKGVDVIVFESFYKELTQKTMLTECIKVFNNHKDLVDTNYLFSIGGDGTLLETVALVRDSNIPVLGINTGRLGFLTSIATNQIEQAINEILKEEYDLDKRTLLSIQTENNLFGEVNYALNEITLQKTDTSSMLTIQVYLGDDYLNSYWADGLIISTPTGSTAYSLSCGGPIILPVSGNIIINPIAPHNLNVRPIVIPDNIDLTMRIEGRTDNFLVALDSRSLTIPLSTEIKIKKANHSISLIRLKNHSFLTTLRTKLMWGLDRRNY